MSCYKEDGFAVLIKGGDKELVSAIADRLCKAVDESRTEHKHSKISDIVTLSIGVSAIYPEAMTILKSRTDNALHNAQIAGGNQISNDGIKRTPVRQK